MVVTYTNLVEDYIEQFDNNASIKDIVFTIVKDNLINKKALRNKAIVKDFDSKFKQNNTSVITIYDDLAYKYNLSNESIRKIIAFR